MGLELLGWIGGSLLAFCSIPQAIKSVRDRNSDGLSHWFLWMWGLGELFTLVYILPKKDMPLILNYSVNCGMIGIIAFYKYFPKRYN